MKLFFFTILLIAINGVLSVRHKHYPRAPIIDLNGAEELVGIVREDGKIVTITPNLQIQKGSGPVCRYDMTPEKNTKELPFDIRILDNALGTAQIMVRDGAEIDCSDVEFRMKLVAVHCADDSVRSEPVLLKVVVQDVNNHAPEFDAPWYTFDVEEGKTAEITRLFAIDKDCGHPYGAVCRYEITNAPSDSPFRIDDQGKLSTIRPLNHSQADSHILVIVAHDCAMLKSKSTLVTIHVKPKCVDGIRQPSSSLDPLTIGVGEHSKPVFRDASVVSCGNACKVKGAELEIRLIKGDNAEKLDKCGLNPATIELLKSNQSKSANEDEDESDEEEVSETTPSTTSFDGKSISLSIPEKTVKDIIPETFSLHFSMKASRGLEAEQKMKQNILCETDLNGLNRHHFALYIRHCKLELLLRREAENAEAEFRAAEWRWADDRVCDENWHSYAVLFSDVDNVKLIIDGETFNATERNPEILDDWPLHRHKNKKTRLVVGACWHGRAQKMVQFFRGQLSSMFLLIGKVEPEAKIECLHGNNERLVLELKGTIASDEAVSFNGDHSKLILKANTLNALSSLLQKVQYNIDSKLGFSARSGSISVSGHLKCEANGKDFIRQLPSFERDFEFEQNVSIPSKPSISITAQSPIYASQKNLKTGTSLLPNVQIVLLNETNNTIAVAKNQKLEWCSVHMNPPREMDLEFFSSPATLMASLNVDFVHDKQGILLRGRESADNYAKILMKIRYFNTRPDAYQSRVYKLQCGGSDDIKSNEVVIKMEIDESDEIREAVSKLSSLTRKLEDENLQTETAFLAEATTEDPLSRMVKHFEPSSFGPANSNRLQNILEMDLPKPKALHGYENASQTAIAGGAVAIVVVICIGILLALLVVGVVKMRDSDPIRRRRSRRDSFEWDDNGMNLTINPLEGLDGNEGLRPALFNTVDEGELEESCSDGESYRDEDVSEDEDGQDNDENQPLKENGCQGLEWDNDGQPVDNSKSYRF